MHLSTLWYDMCLRCFWTSPRHHAEARWVERTAPALCQRIQLITSVPFFAPCQPEMLQALTQNPELMAMLRSPRMQEVMKAMMTEGPEAAQRLVADDPELKEMLAKVSSITGGAGA